MNKSNFHSGTSRRNNNYRYASSYMPGYNSESKKSVSYCTSTEVSDENDIDIAPVSPDVCYELTDMNLKDKEYFFSLYPSETRDLKKAIDDELDKLEYFGSFIYHEYPDRVYLQLVIDRLWDSLPSQNEESVQAQNCNGPGCPPPPPPCFGPGCAPPPKPPCRGCQPRPPYYPPSRYPNGRPNWYRQLIETLFIDEMHNRRRRYFSLNQNR